MDYTQAIHFLYDLEHGAVKLGLARIEKAVARRAHPERRYATVHVAGTNGKGSTCAFLAAILEAAGKRTGLLTSPHLLEFNERIRIGGEALPRDEVAALTTELEPLIREEQLSYFEAATLLAFEAFARREVDVAVIEVGMGGRLDATNVIAPLLTVVTGIALDHTKSLGGTVEAIAAEKAGIMKAGVPLLLAECSPGVREVFTARASALSVPVVSLADRLRLIAAEPAPGGTRYRWERRGEASEYERTVALCGAHQARNALLAEEGAALLNTAGLGIAPSAITRGLAATRWPGRFDIRYPPAGGAAVIFDVAHNPEGAGVLAATYPRWFGEHSEPALIIGMLGDKDHAAFLRPLRAISSRLLLIPLESTRAGPLEALAAAARSAGFTPEITDGIATAWTAASREARPVIVAGSFLTVEAGMRHLGCTLAENLFCWSSPAPEGRDAALLPGPPRSDTDASG